ncbi:2-oxo-4-hydroxy-4-carboxy-5-ureidoimidazoline decarboxylase [Kordiimonas laminariae]|uniref:2-oxo-4-hydroxy-4-carboxy-5-ureidoimidazoline decarboxylase n=1 Tax=Kordiimonas laminariae TaxID=2917717 RepID=UPI001FF5FA60|nr:2-oxo-4-hydroxy-4-carboxy-5-ureidoimidazoline decarboxylase [Kordiimonas laminariae]MCK0070819.1 2-oxo-4-hydroxy-4-carboxy-5-ureidoimidazoline decarboxylase [Kordiimonas laminariae]
MPFMKQRPSEISETEFMVTYGVIYEHSPWIAKGAWEAKDSGNLDTLQGLHNAMKKAVADGSDEAKMRLICAHPDLAGKLAISGELTEESKSEQAGAELDRCTPEEFEEFQTLNADYKTKFGFPFIVAVKGMDRTEILAHFRARINNDRETEFATALEQIDRIAFFRLSDLAE